MLGSITYEPYNEFGTITGNTNYGIFGIANERLMSNCEEEPVEISLRQEIESGPAVVRCMMDGHMQDFEIEIERVDYTNKTKDKGMVIRITDENLLSYTNGIVQGMSGSPILQNGKLVGAVTHVFVDDRNVYLFIQDGEVTQELRSYAALHRISILPYDDLEEFLAVYDHRGDLLCDPDCVSYSVYLAARKGLESSKAGYEMIGAPSPLVGFKSVKNAVEMANIRACYKRDSAALCRFIMWVTETVGKPGAEPVTESGAAAYLDNLRAQIDDYMDLSFPTISAYGPNAAMMHYEAVPGVSDAQLAPEGMLLVDSGGQYLTGTTDVTRTIALGPVTEEMKKHYTLTAVSNLQLMGAVFLDGCTGANLDILAREPMWREELDYKCGTGHGIGYFLNVHETPPSIRWRVFPGRQDTPFEPGMIVSDEPGVYLEGKYGIRIETILEVVDHTTNEWGRFLAFEPLTLVPFDRNLIDPAYLTPDTRKLLNEYHERVRTELMPLMDPEEQQWLILQTEPV